MQHGGSCSNRHIAIISVFSCGVSKKWRRFWKKFYFLFNLKYQRQEPEPVSENEWEQLYCVFFMIKVFCRNRCGKRRRVPLTLHKGVLLCCGSNSFKQRMSSPEKQKRKKERLLCLSWRKHRHAQCCWGHFWRQNTLENEVLFNQWQHNVNIPFLKTERPHRSACWSMTDACNSQRKLMELTCRGSCSWERTWLSWWVIHTHTYTHTHTHTHTFI